MDNEGRSNLAFSFSLAPRAMHNKQVDGSGAGEGDRNHSRKASCAVLLITERWLGVLE